MTAPRIKFEYCALRYLNMWLETEKAQHEALAGPDGPDGVDEAKKLAALSKFATGYRIARNLRTAFDVDKDVARLKPVLDILGKFCPEDFDGELLQGAIRTVENQIRSAYGDRGVLSATTKFLWLKFRTPIIIYDRQARIALKTKTEDLAGFYAKWREGFEKNRPLIDAACDSLPSVSKFTMWTTDEIAEVASQQWFRERVFDIYLWQIGSAIGELSSGADEPSEV